MGLVVRPSIPLRFQGGVAAPLIKRSRSLPAQTGWLVISNKIRIATRAYKVATRPFTNHPVCAAEERDLFIEAQPPLLGKEGNEAGSICAKAPRAFTCNRIKSMQDGNATDPYRIFFPLGIILGAMGVAIWPLYYYSVTQGYSGRAHAFVQM